MMEIRWDQALTDDELRQSVRAARAVVEIAERLDRAQAEVRQRDERIAEFRRAAIATSAERKKLLDRLFAVQSLHEEEQELVCGDGCCHNGLGRCEYCEEPWPCRTYQAAEGKSA